MPDEGSSSKRSYLAKYYDNDDGDNQNGNKKKDKKKKSKKSKRKRHDEGIAPGPSINDWDAIPLPNPNELDKIEQDNDSDDGPVVVEAVNDRVDTTVAETGRRQDTTTTGRNRRDDDDDSSSVEPEAVSRLRRRRHDSFSEDEAASAPRRRHDSSSDSEHKTSDDGNKNKKEVTAARRRHDSFDEHDDETPLAKAPKERGQERHDSSSSDNDNQEYTGSRKTAPTLLKRQRHDSSSSDDDNHHRERMASGHVAGLQQSSKFTKSEAKLQAKRLQQAQAMVDQYGHGETVYRDKLGRRRQGANDEGNDDEEEEGVTKRQKGDPSTVSVQEQQRALNTGKVQKEQEEQRQREWQALQKASFARHADDEALEQLRKSAIRAGDPMAAKAAAAATSKAGATIPVRPVYKGPPAKPNRFGIRPGFRWDGVDRGNGFEDKLLAQQFNKAHQQEKAYRWSTADM